MVETRRLHGLRILEKAMMKWRQVYLGSSNVGGIGTEYVSAIFTGDGESVGFGAVP